MALYSVFFIFFDFVYLNLAQWVFAIAYFIPIPTGMRTVFFQGAIFFVCTLILINNKANKQLLFEIVRLIIIWLPWVLYILTRVEYDNEYSKLKIGHIIISVFLTLFFVTIAFFANRSRFEKLIMPLSVVTAMIMVAAMLISPDTFKYNGQIERAMVIDVNPIWVSRSLLVGVLALFLMPNIKKWLKIILSVVLIVAALQTGSRGPLLSLIIVLGFMFVRVNIKSANGRIKIFLGCLFAVVILIVTWDFIAKPIEDYFGRDSEKTMFEESGRSMMFNIAFQEFLESPIIGQGLGQFGKQEKNNRVASGDGVRMYPHNVILEVMSELGLIGLVLFLMLFCPGRWVLDFDNKYVYLFYLCTSFAMTSGDIYTNIGPFVYAHLARLNAKNDRTSLRFS